MKRLASILLSIACLVVVGCSNSSLKTPFLDEQVKRGVMYALGDGVPKDLGKAFDLWKDAAELGDACAQFNLGQMYANGDGVPKDPMKAVEWYQKAAMQGHVSAQNNLGVMYALGGGVPMDNVLAHAWGNLAASKGVENAVRLRDLVTLTPAERAEAQRLSSQWKPGQLLKR